MRNAICLTGIPGYQYMHDVKVDGAITVWASRGYWNLTMPRIEKVPGLGSSTHMALTWDGGIFKPDHLRRDVANFIYGYCMAMGWEIK